MAMTLEDAERVWGAPRSRPKHRTSAAEREIQDWGYAPEHGLAAVPAWAPVVLAGLAGLLVGAAILWVSETQDYRIRAILKRSDFRFADLED